MINFFRPDVSITDCFSTLGCHYVTFCISVIGSVVEYNVANVVARVRFPDDAFLSVWVLTQSMFDANYRERKFVSFELIGFLLGSLHKSWKIQFAFPD